MAKILVNPKREVAKTAIAVKTKSSATEPQKLALKTPVKKPKKR
jgi:hypothetical protein